MWYFYLFIFLLFSVKVNMPTWSKPIKSGDLKKIFQSFHVDIPDEPAKDSSFVREILNIDALKKLVTEITLLKNGVVLTSETEDVQPGNVYVYEVEVVCNEDGLAVVEKVSLNLIEFFSSFNFKKLPFLGYYQIRSHQLGKL